MSRLRPALLALALALPPSPAAAQFSFFPSARPEEPPVPPGAIPGGRAPPAAAPDGPGQPAPAPSEPRPPPAPPKPIVLKAPSEEGVVNQELKLNGRDGSLKVERIGAAPEPAAPAPPRPNRTRAAPKAAEEAVAPPPPAPAGPSYRLRLTLVGAKVSEPTQSCTVKLDGEEPLELEARGKPDGLPRFELKGPACPLSFEVLDGAVWVRGPAEACTFASQDCRADPKGLWGPEPAALFTQAKAIETARGQADRAVRENYKIMTGRAKPHEVRGVVQEQAAFSSERETLCRAYAREAGHGFCNTRFTEARAVALSTRLGAMTPTVLAEEAAPRPRPRPRPAVVAAPPEGTQPQAQPQQQRSIFWPFFR